MELTMTVHVWGYLDEYQREREEILECVDTVFSSGKLILGKSVHMFEQEFADYHRVAHCVGVDNGTNAIKLALEAFGIGPGDEVITVSNTAAPTVVAIVSTGATPVFVDVREDDFLMDTTLISAAITARTKAIVPVHLYGQCVDMAAVSAIAREHGLVVVEDCAQAHGARQHGQVAGTWGDASSFSFYPTKVLGAYGDGGAVLTPHEETDRALRRLRFYGMESDYHTVATPAHNSRLDEVHAEILRKKLTRLDRYIDQRRAVAARYGRDLGDTALKLPLTVKGNEHVYYVYVVRHPARDSIIEAMREHGVQLNVSYRWPVHLMTGFAYLGYQEGSLPVTEKLAGEIFSLPMFASLRRDDQDRTVDALRDVLDRI